jgi:NAD(P)-dependent dehydrogenase (short-subunit alcohol dehydrogenase family)
MPYRPTPPLFPTHAGRVAVVTGAAQGLGQTFSVRLAERGAIVVGVDCNDLSATADLVTPKSSFLGIKADVSSEMDTRTLANKVRSTFGRCDILINNAAIYDPESWDDLDFQRWRSIHSVNLDGPFLMTKALVPVMAENKYGRIVNLVSSTINMPMPIYIAYRSAKMGLVGLTRALASLGDRGITANCVSPTLTRTPGSLQANAYNEILFNQIRDAQSIKLDAVPDDIAYTVMFLTSEESYWITGQAIPVDGGMQFGMP